MDEAKNYARAVDELKNQAYAAILDASKDAWYVFVTDVFAGMPHVIAEMSKPMPAPDSSDPHCASALVVLVSGLQAASVQVIQAYYRALHLHNLNAGQVAVPVTSAAYFTRREKLYSMKVAVQSVANVQECAHHGVIALANASNRCTRRSTLEELTAASVYDRLLAIAYDLRMRLLNAAILILKACLEIYPAPGGAILVAAEASAASPMNAAEALDALRALSPASPADATDATGSAARPARQQRSRAAAAAQQQ